MDTTIPLMMLKHPQGILQSATSYRILRSIWLTRLGRLLLFMIHLTILMIMSLGILPGICLVLSEVTKLIPSFMPSILPMILRPMVPGLGLLSPIPMKLQLVTCTNCRFRETLPFRSRKTSRLKILHWFHSAISKSDHSKWNWLTIMMMMTIKTRRRKSLLSLLLFWL